MYKLLTQIYNSFPLRYLAEMRIGFYLHPGAWKLNVTKRQMDLGPLELYYGYSGNVWDYSPESGIHRRKSDKQLAKIKAMIEELQVFLRKGDKS